MNPPDIAATELTPILYVRDFDEAMEYYTTRLLFRKLWEWGSPAEFGAVALGRVEIFFCRQGQGHPGTWLSIFMEDVDDYHDRIRAVGAEIVEPPGNRPWGMREMHVRDPNGHVIRFGHGIVPREPKIEIERVNVTARVEKRLAALLEDLALEKEMSVGETIEELLLHSFEKVPRRGVASPHAERTHARIPELKTKHGIDFGCHANYRFQEK